MWKKLKDFFSLLEKPFHPVVNVLFRILFILWVVVFMVCSILFPTRDCSGTSADIPTAYADDLGIEYYDYSPISGYISIDNTNDGDDITYSILNTALQSDYFGGYPDYQGDNDYLVAHFAPYVLYPDSVYDDSYDVFAEIDFVSSGGIKGVRISYVVEYYDESVGNTPFVEFFIDHTTTSADIDINIMKDIIEYMNWRDLESIFVLSTRIFVSSPSFVNTVGIPSSAGFSFRFDNEGVGISYAGYLYELSDYISFATDDITVVPITNQIVDMVNNFLQLEIFPGVSFYVILLMAVIIPFVVVILKLWFGG